MSVIWCIQLEYLEGRGQLLIPDISNPSTQPLAMAGPICVEFPGAENLSCVARSESVSALNDTLSPFYVSECIMLCYCPRSESHMPQPNISYPTRIQLEANIPVSTTLTNPLITRFTRYNTPNSPSPFPAAAQTYSNLFKPIQTKSRLKILKIINFQTHPTLRPPQHSCYANKSISDLQ